MLCCDYIMFAFQEKSSHWTRGLRSSHAWYRSRSQWLYITGAKIHDSKTRDGVWLRSSSVGEATTTVVALKRPTTRSYNFPLAVTPLRRVKNIIKSIKVTSQVSSSKIFVCSSPWALQSSRIARGYRFLLTTSVENIKHARTIYARPRTRRRLQ